MKVLYTMAILAAAGLLCKGFCADKTTIADVVDDNRVDQDVEEAERYIGDRSMGLRSLRGFPTNRRRVASDADIDVVEQKSRTVESDGRGLQENDNPTEAFLSIVKNDGISSCKGILVHPDWIITAGRCADGALTIAAWIGVNNTSYLPDDYTTADSDVERHIITHADINMSPGHDSTKPDGEFAMLHLNVASNKTAALAKSDFQALGW